MNGLKSILATVAASTALAAPVSAQEDAPQFSETEKGQLSTLRTIFECVDYTFAANGLMVSEEDFAQCLAEQGIDEATADNWIEDMAENHGERAVFRALTF